MKLSKKALKEFKQIYLEEYGKELKDSEALEKATKLLVLVKAIYKPIPNLHVVKGSNDTSV